MIPLLAKRHMTCGASLCYLLMNYAECSLENAELGRDKGRKQPETLL